MKQKLSIAALAALCAIIPMSTSFAEVIERTVTTTETILPGHRTFTFTEFDVNRDTILSVNEVGEMLFNMYDLDGNEVLDNIEYEKRSVVTVVPVEKEILISYDFDNDGLADAVQRSEAQFMQETLLTLYDRNKDGLSPREFTGRDFMEADINNDRAVELKEWQGSYIAILDKKNKEEAQVNK